MRFRIDGFVLTATMAAMLASCGGGIVGGREGRPRDAAKPPRQPARAVSDTPVKIGAPYTVRGVTYTPADVVSYDEVGYASWYGEEQNGNATANGEPFNAGAIAAAHRTLPLPSYVEVTALDTGRTILVRINDRGPFSNDRLIDLSRGAAEQLGIMGHGAVPVRVRLVSPPEQERTALRAGRQAAERMEAPKSLLAALGTRLQTTQPKAPKYSEPLPPIPMLSIKPPTAAMPLPPGKTGYIVQLAAFSTEARAHALADRIGATVFQRGSLWRVRYGPYSSQDAAKAGVAQAASKGFRDARIVAND